MNENLFEYSDMLRSPIEAFCCGTGYWEGRFLPLALFSGTCLCAGRICNGQL